MTKIRDIPTIVKKKDLQNGRGPVKRPCRAMGAGPPAPKTQEPRGPPPQGPKRPRRRAATARRRHEWAPARSSHGALIKRIRRRSKAGVACTGEMGLGEAPKVGSRPGSRSNAPRCSALSVPLSYALAACVGAAAAPHSSGPAARGRRRSGEDL